MTAGVDHAAGQGQAVHTRHVPFAADVGLGFRHADGLVAVVLTVLGLAEFGIEQGDATEQTHAGRRLTEHRQLDPAVALFTAIFEHLILDDADRLARLEHRQAATQATAVVLHTHFGLFGHVGRQ